MLQIPLLVNGEELRETSGGTVEVTDPSTGEVIAIAAQAGIKEVESAVRAARENFERGEWRLMKPVERGRILHRIGEVLLAHRQELAELECRESGKPLRDAYWEVDCSARFFEFYGGYVDKVQGTTVPLGPGFLDWTVREPIGVSLHIVPWNYPLQVAARGVAPALAAGCTVILKPATETPASAYWLAKLAEEVGLPAGTLSIVVGSGSVVGDALARHPAVDQIAFTGSVSAGRQVMEAAASHTIPATVELGGKSPQILFDDANISRVLRIIQEGMFCHAGQVCNAGSRLILHEQIYDQVVGCLHDHIQTMSLGRALDDPDMGPVISHEQKRKIEEYVRIGRAEGAKVLMGSQVSKDPNLAKGSFVPPVLLTDVANDTRVAQEEIFGPVLAVIPFSDDEEAIKLANDSDFGLVAGVFTSDLDRAMRASEQLRVGQVWINSFGTGLDVEFPFGGYKRSGFGREKGLEALSSYMQIKNTCIAF